MNDYIWYACYGSNLSSERFACYIESGICRENGKFYPGCRDKSRWTDDRFVTLPGRMYFGRRSEAWGGGVAFYEEDEESHVRMRLYRITREQFDDVVEQEGSAKDWYGHMVCLGSGENGEPIFTFTSNVHHAFNAPSPAYYGLIRRALIEEGGYEPDEIDAYLEECLK